jgi:mannose-6-phosphate isomerase-like protein (cupin superfamily)
MSDTSKANSVWFEGEPDMSQAGEAAGGLVNPVDAGFIRPVDLSLAPDDRFFAIQLHLSSEIMFTLCGNSPGNRGPAPHSHGMDQFFYVLEGTLEIVLGQETHVLESGSVVYIPAGTPHMHRNPGTDREMHLEVIVPGIAVGRTFMRWEGDRSTWNPGGSVVHLASEQWNEPEPGLRSYFISEPSGRNASAFPDSRELMWFVLQSQPDVANGMAMHMHSFHQFYYVTEGTFAVDIGFEHHEVGPHTLISIPAGVPHGNSPVGTEPETHLTINVPPPLWEPTPDNRWDVPVTLLPREP